ncbi:MAG: selenocysteine-specific translation elongation factor [Gemmatimonadales bacterium]|nr:selenocysteine-specific translation elongation factor [Gemmatimonadales bacterium]
MERHVVIGTAGHIDHGKTTLVKALTGVDTDRLAEEKARGITIDLGFAPLDLGAVAASVVDVPGHEGFIRNMVAGATGVDLALLVVAADEGVMPQTREHLAILRFLGVTRGVVALTKCDLAPDADWRALVADELNDETVRHFSAAWPIVEVSATQATGLERLRETLARVAQEVSAHGSDDRFRLPVDRVFALAGAGTIVTGTVWSGCVAEGDRVLVLPAAVEARVRSIQVHEQPAPRAEPGRRAALALVGLSREQAARGSVVLSGEGWRAGRAMDVEITLLPGAVLKPRARVRVHHGTAEVMARVTRRGDATSSSFPARLILEDPLVARAGDRLVLRSYSPVTTIGGGLVVDPWADDGALRRAKRVLPTTPTSDQQRVVQLIARRGRSGLALAQLEVIAGLGVSRLTAVLGRASEIGLVEVDRWYVAVAEVDAAAERLREALERYHAAHPLEPGMPAQAWRASLVAAPAQLVELAERRLVDQTRRIVKDGSTVRLPDFEPGRSGGAPAEQERVLEVLRAADAEPPTIAELAAGLPGVDVPAILRLLARSGAVVAVAKDRYYEAGAIGREQARLVDALKELGPSTPAGIRDRLGRSRKWLIPLLEWADREGVTVREGDRRALKKGP